MYYPPLTRAVLGMYCQHSQIDTKLLHSYLYHHIQVPCALKQHPQPVVASTGEQIGRSLLSQQPSAGKERHSIARLSFGGMGSGGGTGDFGAMNVKALTESAKRLRAQVVQMEAQLASLTSSRASCSRRSFTDRENSSRLRMIGMGSSLHTVHERPRSSRVENVDSTCKDSNSARKDTLEGKVDGATLQAGEAVQEAALAMAELQQKLYKAGSSSENLFPPKSSLSRGTVIEDHSSSPPSPSSPARLSRTVSMSGEKLTLHSSI